MKNSEKYLTLHLNSHHFAIPVSVVKEVHLYIDLTPVPGLPDNVVGLINVRSQIIPVIDLKRVLLSEDIKARPESCIVIVKAAVGLRGLLVDHVGEVTEIAGGEVENVKETEIQSSQLVSGFVQRPEGMILMMDYPRFAEKAA